MTIDVLPRLRAGRVRRRRKTATTTKDTKTTDMITTMAIMTIEEPMTMLDMASIMTIRTLEHMVHHGRSRDRSVGVMVLPRNTNDMIRAIRTMISRISMGTMTAAIQMLMGILREVEGMGR